jgi:AcrR family transcriptional regulator
MRANARIRNSPPSPSRKQPKQQRSRDMVETILRATARVLVEHGYDGTNTNLVAETAGVSVGSLYQYFRGKDELIAELISRHVDRMWGRFEARAALLQHAPLAVAAREIIHTQMEAHAVDPELHRVIIEQVPRTGQLARVIELRRRVTGLVEAFLRARQDQLRIAPAHLGTAAFIVVNMVEGVAHSAILQRRELLQPGSRERLVDETVDAVLRYLAKD